MVTKNASGPIRLFIDPASKRTGWALFDGLDLVVAGSISSADKVSLPGIPKTRSITVRVETRLGHIAAQYRELVQEFAAAEMRVDEVYFERFDWKATNEVVWSVGAIMAAVEQYVGKVIGDDPALNNKRWQKRVGWIEKDMKGATLDAVQLSGRGLRDGSPLYEYLPAVDSIDCLAAVGMGLSYVWDKDFRKAEKR